MKLRKLDTQETIDFDSNPVKITSAESVVVRPGKTQDVKTNLELLASEAENARLEGNHVVGRQIFGRQYEEIKVTIFNTSLRDLEIKPGDTVARLKCNPIQTATFTTRATFQEAKHVK